MNEKEFLQALFNVELGSQDNVGVFTALAGVSEQLDNIYSSDKGTFGLDGYDFHTAETKDVIDVPVNAITAEMIVQQKQAIADRALQMYRTALANGKSLSMGSDGIQLTGSGNNASETSVHHANALVSRIGYTKQYYPERGNKKVETQTSAFSLGKGFSMVRDFFSSEEKKEWSPEEDSAKAKQILTAVTAEKIRGGGSAVDMQNAKADMKQIEKGEYLPVLQRSLGVSAIPETPVEEPAAEEAEVIEQKATTPEAPDETDFGNWVKDENGVLVSKPQWIKDKEAEEAKAAEESKKTASTEITPTDAPESKGGSDKPADKQKDEYPTAPADEEGGEKGEFENVIDEMMDAYKRGNWKQLASGLNNMASGLVGMGIGMDGLSKELPEYVPSKYLDEMISVARRNAEQGMPASEENYLRMLNERGLSHDLGVVKRAAGGSGGAVLGNRQMAITRFYDANAQVSLQDQRAKLEATPAYMEALREGEHVYQKMFELEYKQAVDAKNAAADLVNTQMVNMNNADQFNRYYGPDSMNNLYKWAQLKMSGDEQQELRETFDDFSNSLKNATVTTDGKTMIPNPDQIGESQGVNMPTQYDHESAVYEVQQQKGLN